MTLELLGSRILAPHYGSSLFVWGSLIGVVLAGLSLGYYYGGKKSDSSPSFATFSVIIFLSGVYVLLIAFTSGSIMQIALAFNLGERYGPLFATVLLLGPPSFILGMVSPYAIKLSTKDIANVGSTAGNLYFLSTFGSIAGVFATTFFLIPQLGVKNILFSVGVLLVVISIFGIPISLKAVGAAAIVFALVSLGNPSLNVGGVVFQQETLYHRLVVLDDPIGGTRTLLLDNHLHSAMDLRNPDRIVYVYTALFHLGFAYNPNIEKVLFIGGGGFSGPKRFLQDYPEIEVDVVEIDSEVVGVAREYFHVPEYSRLNIYIEDGRQFLAKTEKKYDLIVLDAYAKTYIPFHLMTDEYFQEVYNHLTENGVFISNIIAALTGPSSDIFKAEYKTMAQSFLSIDIFPVSGSSTPFPQNIIVVATKNKKLSSDTLTANLEKAVKIPGFTSYLNLISRGQVDTRDYPVLTDDFAPVENYLNPLTGQPNVKEILTANNASLQQIEANDQTIILSHPNQSTSLLALGLGTGVGLMVFLLARYRESAHAAS